jgi:hypothetical protein
MHNSLVEHADNPKQPKPGATAFEKFCGGIELPNLEQKTVAAVKLQLAASFGDGDFPCPTFCHAVHRRGFSVLVILLEKVRLTPC